MENKKIDIKQLADLARIEVPEGELAALEKEIPEILGFVEEVQMASGELEKHTGEHYNVMREDTDPHERGMHSEELLKAAPAREGNRVKVTQVIKR